MRQIGTLSTETHARRLSDHLVSLGMRTRVEQATDGWSLWVFNEDHVPQAREELDAFLKSPDDARYQSAKAAAQVVEREKRERDRQFRKNFRSMSGHWDRPSFRGRPLTVTLMIISVAVYFLTMGTGEGFEFRNRLLFSSLELGDRGTLRTHGLDDILHGEVWRLITPIFLHGGPVHIFFNMMCLNTVGTVIERRRGSWTLAALAFLAAISSNVAEFAYELMMNPLPGYFGGMSGVVYALFGYVWMKGRFEPEQGMILHPQTVRMMLVWLVVCMTGVFGPIANVAHLVGMIVGMLFGLARF